MKSLRDSKLLWVLGTLSIICAIFPGLGEYAKLASAIYWFGGIIDEIIKMILSDITKDELE